MTKLLETAIEAMRQLSPEEQDEMARLIMETVNGPDEKSPTCCRRKRRQRSTKAARRQSEENSLRMKKSRLFLRGSGSDEIRVSSVVPTPISNPLSDI